MPETHAVEAALQAAVHGQIDYVDEAVIGSV